MQNCRATSSSNIIDWNTKEKKTEPGFDIVIGAVMRFAFYTEYNRRHIK